MFPWIDAENKMPRGEMMRGKGIDGKRALACLCL